MIYPPTQKTTALAVHECEKDNPPKPWRLRTEALQRPGAKEGIASADSAEVMEVPRACLWGSIVITEVEHGYCKNCHFFG